MMEFVLMTISMTVAILLAGVISAIVLLAIMQNPKVIKWVTCYYMKQINKTVNAMEDVFEKELKL